MPEKKLKDIISCHQPFGPIDADKITDKSMFEAFFQKDNRIYQEVLKRPTLIIGRRGSGKTSFMRSVILDPSYTIILELKAHNLFRSILTSIDQLSTGSVFVEEVSELWEVLFWLGLMNEMVKKAPSTDLLTARRYLASIPIDTTKNIYTIIKEFLGILKKQKGDKTIGVLAGLADYITFEDINFDEVREECLKYLYNRQWKAIILIDTLEEMKIEEEKMAYAISGLLRCQSLFRSAGDPTHIRVCLPAEIYHKALRLSSNPNKDFQRKIILHWHAGELLKLACQRYALFLGLHEPKAYKELSHLDLNKRSDAQTFWQAIFPISVKNRLGEYESTLAYILRHTQLLPRHFLLYLNEIARNNFANGGKPLNFSTKSVTDGVFSTEEVICHEIFSAFRYTHPSTEEVCKRCIQKLPRYFKRGDLHRAFNISGVKGLPGIYDYFEFERLMIETGLIGRRIAQESSGSRYISALYEYTVQQQLNVNDEDMLCLHPVVTEVFAALPQESESGKKFMIYPYGSDVDTEDRREIT